MYCAVLVEGVTDVFPECGHFGLGDGLEGGAECVDALFERCACRGQVGAHPCLDDYLAKPIQLEVLLAMLEKWTPVGLADRHRAGG